MNKRVSQVTGTLVQTVTDDKLDQLASLLGLDETEKAKLKGKGRVMVVLDESKSAG